jgi:hypothetical protein
VEVRRKYVSKFLKVFTVVIVVSIAAAAQKADLAVTAGVYHPVNNGFNSGNAFAVEGNLGVKLAGVPFIGLYLEVPVAGTLNSKVPVSALSSAGTYSSIFVTPGLRIKLFPEFPLSPYVAAGGGLAHFSRSTSQTPSGSSSSVNKGVFDIGGGIDMKIAPFLGLRAEVRDFYSGSPELTLNQVTGTFNERQHNIIGTAGLVLRF